MTFQPSSLFVFGLGYTGQACARRLLGEGWQVAGTVRSGPRAQQLSSQGLTAVAWAGHGPVDPVGGAHWLVTLPPDEEGCPLARQVLEAGYPLGAAPLSVTYLSTTGVYGDLRGGWVWEWSMPNPGPARARARVKAETQWRAAAADRLRIVRLPGIYGPGRSALDRIRDGTARRIIKEGQVFSRVHVDDIAGAILALLLKPDAGGVFHFCDDEPAPPQDVMAFAADLLQCERPPEIPFSEAGLSPMAASFYSECKRVSNARARAVLGWSPSFPTYREGLRDIFSREQAAL